MQFAQRFEGVNIREFIQKTYSGKFDIPPAANPGKRESAF
jgi:hypothetical protein